MTAALQLYPSTKHAPNGKTKTEGRNPKAGSYCGAHVREGGRLKVDFSLARLLVMNIAETNGLKQDEPDGIVVHVPGFSSGSQKTCTATMNYFAREGQVFIH